MASLTPLSKGLIALAVVGAMSSAVWHLGLKDWLAGRNSSIVQKGSAVKTDAGGIQQPFPNANSSSNTSTGVGIDSNAAGNNPKPVAVNPTINKPVVGVDPSLGNKSAGNAAANGMSAAENYETGRQSVNAGNFAQARPHLERAIKDQNGAAACLLGEMTLKGQGGISADPEKAAELFRLAQSRDIICFASGG